MAELGSATISVTPRDLLATMTASINVEMTFAQAEELFGLGLFNEKIAEITKYVQNEMWDAFGDNHNWEFVEATAEMVVHEVKRILSGERES